MHLTSFVSRIDFARCLFEVHVSPNAVACEWTSTLTKLECEGMVMLSNVTTVETVQEVMSASDGRLISKIFTIKHTILTESNKPSIANAHSHNDMIKRGENKKANV